MKSRFPVAWETRVQRGPLNRSRVCGENSRPAQSGHCRFPLPSLLSSTSTTDFASLMQNKVWPWVFFCALRYLKAPRDNSGTEMPDSLS